MKSGVYLIRCPYQTVSALKVGFSKDVPRRFKQHKTSNPFAEYIGYIATEDYVRLEREIHRRSKKYKKEWLIDKPEIENYFRTHKNFIEYGEN